MEFKVGDWVLVENKYLGRIKEAVNRVDMPKELFCFCVETFYGGCWYHISDVKKRLILKNLKDLFRSV